MKPVHKFLAIFSSIILVVAVLVIFPNYWGKVFSNSESVFEDSLVNGWLNWSWGGNVNMDWGRISFSPNAWGALYLHNDQGIDTSTFTSLVFSLSPSAHTGEMKVLFYNSDNQLFQTDLSLSNFGGVPEPGVWKEYRIPANLIQTQRIKGFAIQEISGQNQQPIFLDNIYFQPVTIESQSNPIANNQIYSQGLKSGWEDWSWGADQDVASNKQLTYKPTSTWSGLFLHNKNNVTTSDSTVLKISAKSSQGNGKFSIALFDEGGAVTGFIPLPEMTSSNYQTMELPMSKLNPENKNIKGVVLHDQSGLVQPEIYIDYMGFESAGISPVPTATPMVTPTVMSQKIQVPHKNSTSESTTEMGYTVSASKIYKNNSPIRFKGVNWFGMETEVYVPHGLWARNYKDMVMQIKNVGFNAVRLPFCPATLKGQNVSGIDYELNPELTDLNSLQVMDRIMEELNNKQMYIILDHHRPDCQAISELWYTNDYSESTWIDDLSWLATRYSRLDYFAGIDLKNEPHGSATWSNWSEAASRAGKAVHLANPNLLIFVEGVDWGHDLSGQSTNPISTSSIPANKLVFSPHAYGPDVYWQTEFSSPNFPANMPAIWDRLFGSLVNSQYSVVPGEWGGKWGKNGGNPVDIILQNALIDYYKSHNICNSFYWSWNPNSGDTGGILQDDWKSVWTVKTDAINQYFNSCQS
jgi:endoglucanase